MRYSPSWDLATIPVDIWNSESGRRRRSCAPAATNVKLKPCAYCGIPLTARQRRMRCIACGERQPKEVVL